MTAVALKKDPGDPPNRRRRVAILALEKAAEAPGIDPCDVACDAMPSFVDRDLSPTDVSWLIEHTSTCTDCSDELGQYQRLESILDRIELPACAPPEPACLAPARRAGYSTVDSPIGPLHLAASDRGVCEIGFGAQEDEPTFRRHLEERGFRPVADWRQVSTVAAQLTEYFNGERNQFDIPLDLSGVSPFTQSVLEATNDVPFGRLNTYRGIAQEIGRPTATRAVGNALGRNPIPIIVPCHRIVASGGRIGGYTGGLEIKQRLLSIEGVTLA